MVEENREQSNLKFNLEIEQEPKKFMLKKRSQKVNGKPSAQKIKTIIKPIVEKKIEGKSLDKMDLLLVSVKELAKSVVILSNEVKSISKRIGQTQGMTTDEYHGINNSINIGGLLEDSIAEDSPAIIEENNKKIENENLLKTIML